MLQKRGLGFTHSLLYTKYLVKLEIECYCGALYKPLVKCHNLVYLTLCCRLQ